MAKFNKRVYIKFKSGDYVNYFRVGRIDIDKPFIKLNREFDFIVKDVNKIEEIRVND